MRRASLAIVTLLLGVLSSPLAWAQALVVPSLTGLVSGVVLKASAGRLYGFTVTTTTTPGYVMVFNSTTVPADGAVAPLICVAAAAGDTVSFINAPGIYLSFSTGISVAFSTTGCATKTASATAYIGGAVL